MKVGYTEFSYGYAFTENLIRSSPTAPTGAPVFPNLLQEGRSGFDVRINFPAAPLFFQYKLPELMRRGTAFEISKFHCQGLTLPFFRISMMRRDVSRQHELLIELENRYPFSVFYASACLRTVGEFDRAYNSATVARRSAFFSPKEIGALPDSKLHTIAYQQGLPTAYFCSEPKPVKLWSYENLTEQLTAEFQEKRFRRIESSAREIREVVTELATIPMRQSQGAIEQRIKAMNVRLRMREGVESTDAELQTITDILVAREIARVDMGVEVVMAQPNA